MQEKQCLEGNLQHLMHINEKKKDIESMIKALILGNRKRNIKNQGVTKGN